jgi:RNA polymerase sigma factor (sigma-70 family)
MLFRQSFGVSAGLRADLLSARLVVFSFPKCPSIWPSPDRPSPYLARWFSHSPASFTANRKGADQGCPRGKLSRRPSLREESAAEHRRPSMGRRNLDVSAKDEPSAGRLPEAELDDLLLTWQRSGDPHAFEALAAIADSELARVARAVFRRFHLRDPYAYDEARSLVLDHLRRLFRGSPDSVTVQPFDAARAMHGDGEPCGNAGKRYLAFLVRRRAIDVCRSRHRRNRHERSFSSLPEGEDLQLAPQGRATYDRLEPEDVDTPRLEDAISHLPLRYQQVIQGLLAGRTQPQIAVTLGVCEGTVSRLRTRAIESLRSLLTETSHRPQPASDQKAVRSRRSPR